MNTFSITSVLRNENKHDKNDESKIEPKEQQVAPAYVYLTFDDGPNDGTDVVLDALKSEGVNATFFINSIHLDDRDPEVAQRNIKRFFALKQGFLTFSKILKVLVSSQTNFF